MARIKHNASDTIFTFLTMFLNHYFPNKAYAAVKFNKKAAAGNMFTLHQAPPSPRLSSRESEIYKGNVKILS